MDPKLFNASKLVIKSGNQRVKPVDDTNTYQMYLFYHYYYYYC